MSSLLFLAHRVPYPPNRGDRIRSYHMIRYLAQRMDVDLAFLTDSPVEAETRQALEKMCRRVTWAQLHPRTRWLNAAWSLASGRSATEGLFRSRRLSRTLAVWTRDTHYDTVLVFCSSMVQYLERLVASCQKAVASCQLLVASEEKPAPCDSQPATSSSPLTTSNQQLATSSSPLTTSNYQLATSSSPLATSNYQLATRFLVDLVDVDSQKFLDYAEHTRGPKRWLYRLEARRLRRLERSLPARADAILLTTEAEVALYQQVLTEQVSGVRGQGSGENGQKRVAEGTEPRAESGEWTAASQEARARSGTVNCQLTTPVIAVTDGVDLEYFRPEWSVLSGQRSLGKEQEQTAESGEQRAEGGERKAESDSGNSSLATNNYQLATSNPPLATSNYQLATVFVGTLDYRANVDGVTWFCREVWPGVHRGHPDAVFRIVGSNPTAAVLRLGELPGVEVVGRVPDVRPYLRDAAVVVVPLRVARGIQNKVLEAMAMGKPVVASPQALEGIQASGVRCQVSGGENRQRRAESGEQRAESDRGNSSLATSNYPLATANSSLPPASCPLPPDSWISAITRLFADPAERARLGAAGRAYVEQHYSWEACLEPLGKLLGAEDGERRTEAGGQMSGVRGQTSEGADR